VALTIREPKLAVDASAVIAAAQRIKGHAVRTPLLENSRLNERVGGRVLIKPECLQHSGSFKFRGAYNRLSQLDEAARRAGVVAWSSGNHAQGVADAARRLGIAATIVMPADAPTIKAANTRALGATIVPYDRRHESREAIATAIADERGAVLVPSFDDPHIIAGQGTVGLEIAEQARALGAAPESVLVCCGGGGLIAGTATALADAVPGARVYSVEPAGFDDTARSLVAGEAISNDPDASSICDALLAPSPGSLTFPINQRLLAGGLVVTDDEVRGAMRFAFETLKLVVEPAGAVALAALLSGRIDAKDRTTAVVLSGGNVDPELFAKVIAEG
jgi:threonine dehydratase